jgi:hypothetical protein
MSGSALQTEFEFTLPQGYAADDGTLHREGTMRQGRTAAQERSSPGDEHASCGSHS